MNGATTESNVTYDFYVVINETPTLVGSNKEGEVVVTGLTPNTTYTCYVEARDEAGNRTSSDNIQVTTGNEIVKPIITLEGEERRKWLVYTKRSKSKNNIPNSRRCKTKIKI